VWGVEEDLGVEVRAMAEMAVAVVVAAAVAAVALVLSVPEAD